MKSKIIKKYFIFILALTAFIASLLWTYFSYTLIPLHQPVVENEVHFLYKPHYDILARSSSSLWPAGSNIELGNAAYFYAANPLVKVRPTMELHGLENGQIYANVSSNIYIQAVNDKGELYWKHILHELPEDKISFNKYSANRQLSVIELDVINTSDEIVRISKELNFPRAFFQLVLSSEIKITGNVNGRGIDSSYTNNLYCNIGTEHFTIDPLSELGMDIILNPDASKVTASPNFKNILSHLLYPLILDIVLLLYLLSIFRKLRDNKEKEAQNHYRFKNWITNGNVFIKGQVIINIHSLEGLVDLAIDIDKRVIFDPEQGKYFVLDDDLAYIYDTNSKKPVVHSGHQRLGKILLEKGILNPEQLELGLLYHQKFSTQLGQSLVALGFIDEITLYSTLAAQAGISYLDLDPDTIEPDKNYLSLISLDKAKVLIILPLGRRSDDKLVVACGNPYKEGMLNILHDLFNTEIAIVATRPSLIYTYLDKLAKEKQPEINENSQQNSACDINMAMLTQEEKEEFILEYRQGGFNLNTFIKALDIPITENITADGISGSSLLTRLINTGYFNSQQAHLLLGLITAGQNLASNKKPNRIIPDCFDILEQTEYLSKLDLTLIRKKYGEQQITMKQFLIDNYFCSTETIIYIEHLQNVLEKILE